MPNTKKVAVVDDLSQKFTSNSNITLLGFDKTSHIALENLRKAVRKTDSRLSVVKSSLLAKAVEKTPELKDFSSKVLPLKNTTALVQMGNDVTATLKAIFDFAKKETSVFFKMGFLDSVTYDAKSLEKLAQLPSRLVLLGKVVGSLKSPLNRIDSAIKFPMSYFVSTLKARVAKG